MSRRTSSLPWIAVLLAMVTAVSSSAGDAQSIPDVAGNDAVTEAIRGTYAAFSQQDWQAFRESFIEGASVSRVLVISPSNTKVQTYSLDEFIDLHRKLFSDGRRFRQQMRSADVHVSQHVAQVWSNFEVSTEADGVTMTGYDSFTLYKIGDQWKIVSVATQRGGA